MLFATSLLRSAMHCRKRSRSMRRMRMASMSAFGAAWARCVGCCARRSRPRPSSSRCAARAACRHFLPLFLRDLRQQDVLARRQWDRYFTGEETRDVLEVRLRFAARQWPPRSADNRCALHIVPCRMACVVPTWRLVPRAVGFVSGTLLTAVPCYQARLRREVTREDIEKSLDVRRM